MFPNKMQVSESSLVLLSTLLALCLRGAAFSDFSDIPGRYCEARSIPCCDARQDSCSVPIMGTLCYCDQFCDRPDNPDCCPDYPYMCRGMNRTTTTPRPYPPSTPRPAGDCYHKGQWYPQGSVIQVNCNKCTCTCRGGGGGGRDCNAEMSCEQNRCLVEPELLEFVSRDSSVWWRASNYSEFWGKTMDQGLKERLGTRHSKKRAYSMRPINAMFDRERIRARRSYDLRREKPDMISPPLDQGQCAADWALSTVQVATDRLMLVSKGEDRAALAPQHLLSCSKNQQGCKGGHLTRAWKFIQRFGLVPEHCYPWVGNRTECAITKTQDKKRMTSRCADGNSFAPLHRTGPVYRISKDPEAIMNEILTSGPVQATMRVFEDFFIYRSGVYRCPSTNKSYRDRGINYHAVRIIGWGEEVIQGRLVKYWIVSNTWGTWWGEQGYFRIVREKNECEIESLVLASWINPIVPRKDPSMPEMDRNNYMNNALV